MFSFHQTLLCSCRGGESAAAHLHNPGRRISCFHPTTTIVTEAQGRKCLRQITSVMHQPLMKRFCLHVRVRLVWTRESKKSCNPPMSINPSSVISTAGTLFSSGDLTLFSHIFMTAAAVGSLLHTLIALEQRNVSQKASSFLCTRS